MSLNAKFTDAVEKAFAAAGDLVKTATLVSNTVSGFDFATNTAQKSGKTLLVEIIPLNNKKKINNKVITEVILRSGFDMSVYDTITFDSIEYNIVDYTDFNYVITLQLTREG